MYRWKAGLGRYTIRHFPFKALKKVLQPMSALVNVVMLVLNMLKNGKREQIFPVRHLSFLFFPNSTKATSLLYIHKKSGVQPIQFGEKQTKKRRPI